jgi:hypothetical protein
MSATRRHRASLPSSAGTTISSTAFGRFCIGLGATRIIRIPFFGVHNPFFFGYFLCLSERLFFGLWMDITATYREFGHKLSPLGLITAGTWGGHVDCIYSVGTEYRRPLFFFFLSYKRRRSNAPRSAEIRDRIRFYFPFALILLGKTTRRLDWKIPHTQFSVGHGPHHTRFDNCYSLRPWVFFLVSWMTLRP